MSCRDLTHTRFVVACGPSPRLCRQFTSVQRSNLAPVQEAAVMTASTLCRESRAHRVIAKFGLKWIESFEAEVELQESAKTALFELLHNETFCKQVASEAKQGSGKQAEFTELVFTPVPWSPATTKGMPKELEQYHEDPQYVTINVPPNFMFQSKIFKPTRLCALYKLEDF